MLRFIRQDYHLLVWFIVFTWALLFVLGYRSGAISQSLGPLCLLANFVVCLLKLPAVLVFVPTTVMVFCCTGWPPG